MADYAEEPAARYDGKPHLNLIPNSTDNLQTSVRTSVVIDPLLRVEGVMSRPAADPPTATTDRKQSPFSLTNNQLTFLSMPQAKDTRMTDLQEEEGAVNTGSNLFVTGIAPSLTEATLSDLFSRYGEVENCSIMLDPHTKESRGFGFVKMTTSEQADAAKEALQGETHDGRTLSIEKARRARPRTPTPGKYFGPPKRGKKVPCNERMR